VPFLPLSRTLPAPADPRPDARAPAVLALWGLAEAGGLPPGAAEPTAGGDGAAWWPRAQCAVAKGLRRGRKQLTAHDLAHAVSLLGRAAPRATGVSKEAKDAKEVREARRAARALVRRARKPQFRRAWERYAHKWAVNVTALCGAEGTGCPFSLNTFP
jgi:hypothetical protein